MKESENLESQKIKAEQQMNKSSEQTQCYAMQLQIDTFLDGELEGDQHAAFVGHVAECPGCAHELRYAQNLYESVLDLPKIDCNDVLIDNLLAISAQSSTQRVEDYEGTPPETTRLPLRAGLFAQLDQIFRERLPLTIGFAAVSTLVIAVAIVMAPRGDILPQSVVADASSNSVAERSPVTPTAFDAEQVRMALEELNTAIDYLNRVSQQTETMIGERFVVLPLQQSVNSSLRRASFSGNEERQAGPI